MAARLSLPPIGPGASRAPWCCLQPLRAAPGPGCVAQSAPAGATAPSCRDLAWPGSPGAQSQLRPPPARTPVCLPARLSSPDFGAFSASGSGSRSPGSGGRAAAIGKQRRRPVAGACPSPHPAGNLGGALGVSVCVAAPAGWGERAHLAAGWRRELGAGRGSGPRRLPAAATAPRELRATEAARVPGPWPSGSGPWGGGGHPTGWFRRPVLEDWGRRATCEQGQAGRWVPSSPAEVSWRRDAARRLEQIHAQSLCQRSLLLPPVTAEDSRAPSLASSCEEANAPQASQPLRLFGNLPCDVASPRPQTASRPGQKMHFLSERPSARNTEIAGPPALWVGPGHAKHLEGVFLFCFYPE